MAWKGSGNEAHCVYDEDGNMTVHPTLGPDHPDEIIVSAASALGRKRLEEEKRRIEADGEALTEAQRALAIQQQEVERERLAAQAAQERAARREAELEAKEKALEEAAARRAFQLDSRERAIEARAAVTPKVPKPPKPSDVATG